MIKSRNRVIDPFQPSSNELWVLDHSATQILHIIHMTLVPRNTFRRKAFYFLQIDFSNQERMQTPDRPNFVSFTRPNFYKTEHILHHFSSIQEAQKDNLRSFNDHMMRVLEVPP